MVTGRRLDRSRTASRSAASARRIPSAIRAWSRASRCARRRASRTPRSSCDPRPAVSRPCRRRRRSTTSDGTMGNVSSADARATATTSTISIPGSRRIDGGVGQFDKRPVRDGRVTQESAQLVDWMKDWTKDVSAPNACIYMGGSDPERPVEHADPTSRAQRPQHVRARFRNTQIAFVLANLDRAPADATARSTSTSTAASGRSSWSADDGGDLGAGAAGARARRFEPEGRR